MGGLKSSIGLEIHAELKTRTKMFCNSANDPDEKRPNVNICPICLAHPGTLPTINQEAVRQVLRIGVALGGTPADYTEFERKNYFYPDIPRGYQISQYQYPLVSGGELNGVPITRVHLEEDTARSQHLADEGGSIVDFNRAGVPLMELVTEPVIHSAQEAAAFARELQILLRTLGVSEANMEKGEMRVEANVSLSRTDLDSHKGQGSSALGVKVEIKNLNSFRAVERAIEYELKRQTTVLVRGGKVVQETRGWDEVKGITVSQREKESAHDYRYFPDPDLPPLKISAVPEFQNLATTLPELPWQRRERLSSLRFLSEQDIEQLVTDLELAAFFDRVAADLKETALVKISANLILNDVAGQRNKHPGWLPEFDHFVKVVRLGLPMPQTRRSIVSGIIVEVAAADALPKLVDEIIAGYPKVVSDYRAGKTVALQFLVGQAMKQSRGTANPEVVARILVEKLEKC